MNKIGNHARFVSVPLVHDFPIRSRSMESATENEMPNQTSLNACPSDSQIGNPSVVGACSPHSWISHTSFGYIRTTIERHAMIELIGSPCCRPIYWNSSHAKNYGHGKARIRGLRPQACGYHLITLKREPRILFPEWCKTILHLIQRRSKRNSSLDLHSVAIRVFTSFGMRRALCEHNLLHIRSYASAWTSRGLHPLTAFNFIAHAIHYQASFLCMFIRRWVCPNTFHILNLCRCTMWSSVCGKYTCGVVAGLSSALQGSESLVQAICCRSAEDARPAPSSLVFPSSKSDPSFNTAAARESCCGVGRPISLPRGGFVPCMIFFIAMRSWTQNDFNYNEGNRKGISQMVSNLPATMPSSKAVTRACCTQSHTWCRILHLQYGSGYISTMHMFLHSLRVIWQ